METRNKEVYEIDLIEMMKSLKDQIWIVIFVTMLCCGVAFCYLIWKTPIYQSTTTMLVNPIKSSSSMDDLLNNALSSSSNSNISTEVSLITSKQCLFNALNSLDLNKYSSNGESYSNREFSYSELKRMILVSTETSTKVVAISVSDADPYFACDFANAIAQSYRNLLTGIVRSSKSSQRISLEKQIPENQILLDKARRELLDYSNAHGTIEATHKMEVFASYISTIQILEDPLKIQKEQLETDLADNSLFWKIDSILSDENVEVIYNQYAATVKEYYLYQSSANTSIDDRVLVLSSTVSNLSTKLFETILKVETNQEDSLKLSNYFVTIAKINALADIETQYKNEISKYEEILSGEREYQGKVSMYQSLILSLTQLLEETKMVEASAESDSTIIDHAEPSSIPYKPEKLKTLTIAFLIGIVAGSGIAILLWLFDRSVYSEEDIKDVFKDEITSLGWIPYIKQNSSQANNTPTKVVTNNPDSYTAERFRILCANISLLDPEAQVMIFNSMGIGEGKSLCTVNIGATFAATGKRVLIIDCDLRKPELEHALNMKHTAKGVYYVMNGTPLKECIFIPDEKLPNLHVLPAGHSTSNPNVIFSSKQFTNMIKELRKMYDLILLDCPPLSFGSDFMILSNVIDAYALTIRAGVATKDSLNSVLSSIKPINARLLGYIFNGVLDYGRHGYGYNYNYASKYNYSSYYTSESKSKQIGKLQKKKKRDYRKIYEKELDIRNTKQEVENSFAAKPVFARPKESIEVQNDFLEIIEKDEKSRGSKK